MVSSSPELLLEMMIGFFSSLVFNNTFNVSKSPLFTTLNISSPVTKETPYFKSETETAKIQANIECSTQSTYVPIYLKTELMNGTLSSPNSFFQF